MYIIYFSVEFRNETKSSKDVVMQVAFLADQRGNLFACQYIYIVTLLRHSSK